jgi:hypothetical protein
MAKRGAGNQMNSARRKNGFTQSPSAKAPRTMADNRANNGFVKGK